MIDSLITGPDQVKGLSMWEVAPHMTAVGTAGAVGYVVASRRSWDRLSEKARKAILAAVPEMKKVAWDGGYENNQVGVALAKEKGMTVTIPAKPEWAPTFKQLTGEVIMPWWLERVGDEGREAFKTARLADHRARGRVASPFRIRPSPRYGRIHCERESVVDGSTVDGSVERLLG